MKTYLLLSTSLTAIMSMSVAAADWDHKANVRDAVHAFYAAYKSGGIQKSATEVAKCYSVIPSLPPRSDAKLRRLEFCSSLDLAAYQMDDYAAKKNGSPATPYFIEQMVINRLEALKEWFPDSNQRRTVINGLMTQVSSAMQTVSASSKN